MANPDKWQIQNKSGSPADGNDLNGIRIKKTKSGYELYGILGTYSNPAPPAPQNLPSFTNVNWDNKNWNIVFSSLPLGQNGAGTWTLLPSPAADAEPTGTGDETGDFTAMASGGHPEEDGEEAASSASA